MSDQVTIALKLPPGIYRNGTDYESKGRWHDATLVRFWNGAKMPIGGWSVATGSDGLALAPIGGTPRAAVSWRLDAGTPNVAIATTSKLKLLADGTVYDLTPGRLASLVHTGSIVTPVSTAANSPTISFTATTLTGTASPGDTFVISGTTYTVTAFATAASNTITVSVTPNAPPAGIAAGTAATYTGTAALVVGRVDAAYSAGAGLYGANTFGSGAYGTGSLTSTLLDLDTWTLDTFGTNLVGVTTADNRLYVWRGDVAFPAAVSPGSPSCVAVCTTPERFIVTLGAAGVARRVQWASQQTIDVWAANSLTSAGDFDLTTPGKLVCGKATVNETLLWTDVDLWAMRYIGAPLIYQFAKVGDGCGIIAPNAKATLEAQAYWMGSRAFYAYNGYVQQVPCDVADYVFGDFNYTQKSKVFAWANPQFSEVWWHYPSSGSTANDRYVVYNYAEQHWTIGALAREAGVGSGATATPVLCDASGYVYDHETGNARGGGAARLVSGPIELGNGENVMKLQGLIPDSTPLNALKLALYTSMWPTDGTYPAGAEVLQGFYSLDTPTDIRCTAVQARLTFFETPMVPTSSWRLGTVRLVARVGGKRGGSRGADSVTSLSLSLT